MERAGIEPDALRGTSTGVFVGATGSDYGPRMHEAPSHAEGHVLGNLPESSQEWLATLSRLAERGDGVLISGSDRATEFLVAEIGLERDQQKFDSIILLGIRNTKFLKLRFTTPPHQGSAKDAIDFVKAVLSGRPS